MLAFLAELDVLVGGALPVAMEIRLRPDASAPAAGVIKVRVSVFPDPDPCPRGARGDGDDGPVSLILVARAEVLEVLVYAREVRTVVQSFPVVEKGSFLPHLGLDGFCKS